MAGGLQLPLDAPDHRFGTPGSQALAVKSVEQPRNPVTGLEPPARPREEVGVAQAVAGGGEIGVRKSFGEQLLT